MNPRRDRFSLLLTAVATTVWLALAAPGLAVPHPYHDDLGLIPWRASWSAAVQEARLTGKPLFIEMTRDGCAPGATFASTTLADPKIARLLRRHFVCFACDYGKKPPEVEVMSKAKGLNTTPVTLFMTVTGEYLDAAQRHMPPAEFEKFFTHLITDPRVLADRKKEKDLDRHARDLAQALAARDARRIQEAWLAIEKIPGYSLAKARAYELMDQAEAPAWEKLLEAARLVRDHKYPLARVALEEALPLAEALPVVRLVQASQSVLPALEEAAALEKTQGPKWKEKAAAEYQKVLSKYADAPLATVAQLRLRTLLKSK